MEEQIILTKEGHKKILQELEELRKKRKETAIRIQEAKELGDLSENAEYHEAKNEQAFVEGRIMELEETLNNAKVVNAPSKNANTVQIGSTVHAVTDGKKVTYTLVGINEANPAEGKISNQSPLGSLFLGKKRGETVTLSTPKGQKNYQIEDIS